MTQLEVLKCLKDNSKMTVKEVTSNLNISEKSVWRQLNALRRDNNVTVSNGSSRGGPYLYQITEKGKEEIQYLEKLIQANNSRMAKFRELKGQSIEQEG